MSEAGGSPRLASIHIYPLKAGRAVDLAESVVEPWGLAGDRRWLVVDSAGRFVSQREEPALAQVTAAYPAAGTDHAAGGLNWPADVITLSAAGHPPLKVAAPSEDDGAEMVFVAVWKSRLCAAAAGKEADGWLSDFLGRAVRLVYLDDPGRREVDQDFGAPGDRVSFADGYPLQPLATLGQRRRFGQQLVFGQNMIPDTPGSIRVGDPVQVLENSRQLSLPAKTASRSARGYFH